MPCSTLAPPDTPLYTVILPIGTQPIFVSQLTATLRASYAVIGPDIGITSNKMYGWGFDQIWDPGVGTQSLMTTLLVHVHSGMDH